LLAKLSVTTTVVVFLAVLGGAAGQTATAKQEYHNWSRMVYSCEARGIYNPWYANTGNGFYFGPQFTRSTWHVEGGGPVSEMGDRGGRPMKYYSIPYIIQIAENTIRDQGYGAWPNCHGYL
jgi:hypothetical protein